MLSFLREQGAIEDSKKSIGQGHTPNANEEQEYLTVATQDKNVRKSTILLAVLFGIGLLCLWFMIKKSTPQTVAGADVNTEDKQIEIAIARLTGMSSEMFNRMDEIVKKFQEFSDVKQVRVNELVKNPFELEVFSGNLKGKFDAEESDFDIDAERMRRQQQLSQQAENMQLLSIMQSGQGNCCMIDDKILYVGDSIKDFKVCEISDTFVKLVSGDAEVILKLSE